MAVYESTKVSTTDEHELERDDPVEEELSSEADKNPAEDESQALVPELPQIIDSAVQDVPGTVEEVPIESTSTFKNPA